MTTIKPKLQPLQFPNIKALVYLGFGRPKIANFKPEDQQFQIGKAVVLNNGKDVLIIATGYLVWEALRAAEQLEEKGISAEVHNIQTIKPLDEEAIIKSIGKTGCAVTAEEYNFMYGLGENVA